MSPSELASDEGHKPTEHEEFWAGSFGDEYTQRNKVQWEKRIGFFKDFLDAFPVLSAIEVGCNAGQNLKALRFIDPSLHLIGTDINHVALQEASDAHLEVYDLAARDLVAMDPAELVFTAGLLIHIPPAEIGAVMDAIIETSTKYVMAIEYQARFETEISYRDNADRLWKRPYGEMYVQKGLKLLRTCDAGAGFDRCTAWVLEIPQ